MVSQECDHEYEIRRLESDKRDLERDLEEERMARRRNDRETDESLGEAWEAIRELRDQAERLGGRIAKLEATK